MEQFTEIFQRIDSLQDPRRVRYHAAEAVDLDTLDRYKFNLAYSQKHELEFMNDFLKKQGHHELHDPVILNERQAKLIFRKQLTGDFAYGSDDPKDVEKNPDADKLVDDFFKLFNPDKALFVTTDSFYYKALKRDISAGGAGGGGITKATFDDGIVVYDAEKIAYVWFEDED